MRDPSRIAHITALLERVWMRTPDQRLGQVLMNVSPYAHRDPFEVEDDEWERALRGALGDHRPAAEAES